ncbi:hypothetical protein [Cyanobacterium aponinum]|uniref:NUDIX hydrolase n=1 Tax=Cyanobacterium aponinum 0216 TaxID=2676140 RepID=A0A844GTS6_9CHRO|nr:hypothetical protein [Cyanobacterium aponinum]MTF38451.1 hypothetical protein [Cyanobacterium aponinum 0216]
MENRNWQLIDTIVEIKSPWVTLIGERIKDDQDNILDYWRVEKEDSVIVVTRYKNSLIFPKSTFRPGIKKVTIDFAGGRLKKNNNLENTAYKILQRELNLTQDKVKIITPINHQGFIVNSSFSNQKLWGFYCELKSDISLDNLFIGAIYSLNSDDFKRLLNDLQCLQCRSLLLECVSQGLVATF